MKLLLVFACLLMAYVRESLAECDGVPLHNEVTTYLEELQDEPNPGYKITYDLYNRKDINKRQTLRTGDKEALKNSNFGSDLPLRVFINGWTGRSTACSSLTIKDAYLSSGDFNVILVDWSAVALNSDSSWVADELPKVADEITGFIKFLLQETETVLSSTYLIGHNIGCQITGMVARGLQPQIISAIIALEPLNLASDNKLLKEDAWYIESIHTDISRNPEFSDKISHAAFFPNWGRQQPQCRKAEARSQCNHFAAVQYFADSVRTPNLFGAIRCPTLASISTKHNCECDSGEDSCEPDAYMGGEELMPKLGNFYLSTGYTPPYGLNNTVHVVPVQL